MRLRLTLAVLLLALIVLMTGCYSKTYFFSFKDEQDLENAEGEWVTEDKDYEFKADGINLQVANVCCPLRFSGGFTMTVRFYLDADVAHYYFFGISLGDGTWYGTTENDLHIEVERCGAPDESYFIADHDTADQYNHYDEDELLPGLNRDGLNIWILKKVGKHITIEVNGARFASFYLKEYDSIWFGPNIYVVSRTMADHAYGFTLESVKVEYSGATSPMPIAVP